MYAPSLMLPYTVLADLIKPERARESYLLVEDRLWRQVPRRTTGSHLHQQNQLAMRGCTNGEGQCLRPARGGK